MAPNPRRVAAKLDELYAQLPAIDCQGLCVDSCGPIPAGVAERERIERARGRRLEATEVRSLVDTTVEACHECSMMDNGRCAVYDIRPMICRLWGLAENFRCPYGCEPERMLTVEESYAFLARAYAIAGAPPGVDVSELANVDELLGADPRARAMLIAHSRPTIAGRRASIMPTVIERGRRL